MPAALAAQPGMPMTASCRSGIEAAACAFRITDWNCRTHPMSLIIARGGNWQSNRETAAHAAERIANFLLHSDFVKPAIIARSEIIAYAAAVSGLEVVGEAT